MTTQFCCSVQYANLNAYEVAKVPEVSGMSHRVIHLTDDKITKNKGMNLAVLLILKCVLSIMKSSYSFSTPNYPRGLSLTVHLIIIISKLKGTKWGRTLLIKNVNFVQFYIHVLVGRLICVGSLNYPYFMADR